MKKLLLLSSVLMIALFTYSCKNDDPEPEMVYKLEVDTEELTFECDATEAQYINIESENVVWNATVDEAAQNWITIEQTADRVSVTVKENIDIENRDGIIRITPETDQVEAKEIKVIQNKSGKQYDLVMSVGQLSYFGDYFEVDASNYTLHLFSGDAEVLYDEDWDEYYIEIQNGYLVYLDVIASTPVIPDEYRNPKLMAGTYNCSETPYAYEHMTFIKTEYDEEWEEYFNSVVVKYDGGQQEVFMIDAGSVRVDHRGDVYIVTFEFTLGDGTTLSGFYKKEIDILSNYAANSTLQEDLTLDDLNIAEGNLYFFGDDGDTGSWLVEILSDGLSFNNDGFITGSGYFIVLDMYSPTGSSTVLTDGSYIFREEEVAYTASPGGLFWGIFEIGCYVIVLEDSYVVGKAFMTSGQIDVKNNGGDNYTFDIDAQSDLFYKVDIDYTSDLSYVDYTRSADKKSNKAFKVKAGKPKTFQLR